MAEQTQDPSKTEIDDKGVPLTNRLKEMERKLHEREAEFEDLRRWKSEYEAKAVREREATTGPSAQEKLLKFVGDPDAYIGSMVEERERKRQQENLQGELRKVKPWFESQKGYNAETDMQRIMEIEREYAISHPSPLQRAEKIWDILQKERALAKFDSSTEDAKREERLKATGTEGAGKASPKTAPITRNDLLRKLKSAEETGDLDASIKLIGLLEDTR